MPRGGRDQTTKSSDANKATAQAEPAATPPPQPLRPLKPRPVLLAVMAVIFALWMGFLVTLYFKTIHPRRSVAPDGVSSAIQVRANAYSNS